MSTVRRALAAALATALCYLVQSTASGAHPLRLEDLLEMEAFASARIDPSGRWLMLEVEVPYERAARFDYFWLSRNNRSRLLQVDLLRPGPPRLAFHQPPGGYILGPFSPSGRFAVVFREVHFRREAGVLTLANGRVRWLGFGAELDTFGQTALWRSDSELLILALDARDRPFQDRATLGGILDMPKAWRRALAGEGDTAVVNGSGRFLDEHPREPDRRLLDINVKTGRQRLLAKGDFAAMSMSPRADQLALLTSGERVQVDPDELIGPGFAPKRRALTVLEFKSGRLWSPAPTANVMPRSIRWSRQGALLFAAGSREPPVTEPVLFRLDPGAPGAKPLCLTERASNLKLKLAAPGVHLDWMGEEPLVYATAGSRADWYRLTTDGAVNLTGALKQPPFVLETLNASELVALDTDGLKRVDRTGRTEMVLAGPGLTMIRPVDSFSFPPTPIDDPTQASTMAVSTAGLSSKITVIGPPHQTRSFPLAAPTSAYQTSIIPAATAAGALLLVTTADGVTVLTWVGAHGRQTPLLRLNRHLASVDWSVPKMIEHLGSDGRLLKDWLYLPPNAPPGAIYPLVVLGYPTAVWDVQPRGGRPGAEQVDDNEQLLAAQGFAVLAPSLPRRGADFTDGMTQAVLEAVDRASRVPGVDARRVGFWGHSGGGMLGFKLATETRRFSAIIAAAGLSDLVNWRGEMRPSDRIGPDWDFALHGADEWTENGQGGLHATPYTDLGHYIQASPIFSADKITTPMLIVQGDNDSRPFEQSEEMFSALYRLKKDAVFMDFLGEDHCFGSPANIRRYINTGVRFLKRELAPRP